MSARRDSNAFALTRIMDALPEGIHIQKKDSIIWSTNKRDMREHIASANKSITPRFVEVSKNFEDTIQKAVKEVGFPLMIKPAGLASSLLITASNDEDDLRVKLKDVQEKIVEMYAKIHRTDEPLIILEQQLTGTFYSIDSFVDKKGIVYHMPIIKFTSAKEIGFDDYFVYRKDTPVILPEDVLIGAQEAVEDAIKGLELYNSSTHCELIHTAEGWYIIEIGPRIGRFRHEMYGLSYGLDHSLNDMLIHMGKEPLIKAEPIAFTSAFTFFAKKEGVIKEINGVDEAKNIDSYILHRDGEARVGGTAKYARNGGKLVVEFILSNKDQEKLIQDITALESMIEIVVE